MTSWIADYVSRIAPADLKAAGVVGVCRYLADSTTIGKIIGQAEYDELRAAGIVVLLNWEQRADDWLGGATKGAAHAVSAVRQARDLGYPPGSVIVGSADFNMSSGQWQSYGRAYAVAFRDALNTGGFTAGVYGPYDVLTWVRQLGGFALYWQAGMSTSWSNGRNASLWPGAHLRQRRHVSVGGHDTDYNDIVQSDWLETDMSFFDEVDHTTGRTGAQMVADLWYANFKGNPLDVEQKALGGIAGDVAELLAKPAPTATVDPAALQAAVDKALAAQLPGLVDAVSTAVADKLAKRLES